jgi:outer membrane protein TolC
MRFSHFVFLVFRFVSCLVFAALLAAFLSIPMVASAQSTTSQNPFSLQALTLQDAIAMAQSHSSSAQVARSVRDGARYRNDAFNARLLPQLFLSGTAANLAHGINPITLPDGSTEYVGQAQNQSSFTLGFSQQIPLTGGTVSVSSGVSRIDLFGVPNGRSYQTTPFTVSLQQDLFKPRTVVWNERIQSLTASVAGRAYLEAREDVAGATADAFFDLYAQQMTLANALGNVAVNDTLYTLNKGRFDVGKIGENDLLKSELALLRARAAVEDARLARDRAEAALRRNIAYPDGQPMSIVTPNSIPTVAADPDVAVAQALRNSSSMNQNALDEVTARQGIEQARSNNRFNATILASAGFNQTAETFGQSYQSPLGAQSLTVGVQLPMLQWGAGHAEVEGAKADEARAAANNKIRRDALVEDARFSALQLQQAERNIVLAAKADTVAEREFDVARNRYTVSKISNTELYTAQDEKDAAVIAYVQALRTYWTAYYHLRRVSLYDFVTRRPLSDE